MKFQFRMFLSQVYYDLHASWGDVLYSFLMLTCCCLGMLSLEYLYAARIGISLSELTFADNVLLLFAGKQRFEWRPGLAPTLPLNWIVLLLLICFISLRYPYSDLVTTNYRSLVETGSRKKWLAAKFFWSFAVSTFSLVLILLVCALVSFFFKQQFSAFVTMDGVGLAGISSEFLKCSTSLECGASLLICAFSIMAIVALQLFLSVLIHPFIGFGATCAQLLAAYFFWTPLLPANGTMFIRSDVIFTNGLSGYLELFFSLITIVIVYIIGQFVFSRIDLL